MIPILHEFFMRIFGKTTLSSLFLEHTFYCWLAIAFLFLIMEMGHPGLFFFLSFSFGGLTAAFASYVTDSFIIEMLAFFGGTVVALYILRYWGIYSLGKSRPAQQTNFYALKGKRALVKQDIFLDKPGLVTIGGQVWAACLIQHDSSALIGDVVEVVDVRGAHVVVKKV